MTALSHTVPLTGRSGASSPGVTTHDPYDRRDLQEKALRSWEKQKRVWSNIEANIQRRVLKNSKVRGACMNMSQGVYQTRLRAEECALVGSAVPASIFSGVYTWESTLRTSEEGGALRYLKVGKTDFPYPLYEKVTDKARLDPEHLNNTRIVFEHEQLPKDLVTTSTSTTTTTSIATLTNNTTDEGEDEVSACVATCKQSQEALAGMKPVSFGSGSYYEEKIQRYLPLIRQRMSHFFLPRAYLEICGQPPSWTTNVEDAQAAKKATPAVVHIPPPPLKKKLPATSLDSTNSTMASQKQQREKRRIYRSSPVDSVLKSASLDVAPTSDDDISGELLLEISSTRLLFFVNPGELGHGFVKVKNKGLMTVYYTWEPHQPITALDGDPAPEKDENKEEGDEEDAGKSESTLRNERGNKAGEVYKGINSDHQNHLEEVEENEEKQQQEKRNKKGITELQKVPLRSLAQKSAQSKSFFCLSTPFDGVILPGDEEIFPFSVRAPFPGRFTQHYEFLVIPVVSAQIIVELCAIVRDSGPLPQIIAHPIANAIESKAAVDAQRVIINELVVNEDPYEAVEIEKATQQQIALARAPAVAREALTSKWREAWNEFTYTALRIPFNSAVYARLDALHSNLAHTMESLGQPLHHKDWNGSVQTLQADLCMLRDAPSRNTLREAFNVLLQAASVSEQETESLDLLLQRVAGTVAFTTLAQHACELDDAIAVAVGLRTPPNLPITSAVQNTRSFGSGSGAVAPASTGTRTASTGVAASSGGRRGGSSGNVAGKAPAKLSARGRGVVTYDSYAGIGHVSSVSGRGASGDSLSAGVGDTSVDAAVKEEYNTRFFLGMRRLVGDAVDRVCAMWDSSRSSLEAACGLFLLDTIERARAKDVRVIQDADEMDIDFTVDVQQPKKRK